MLCGFRKKKMVEYREDYQLERLGMLYNSHPWLKFYQRACNS